MLTSPALLPAGAEGEAGSRRHKEAAGTGSRDREAGEEGGSRGGGGPASHPFFWPERQLPLFPAAQSSFMSWQAGMPVGQAQN
jgi:hypothetical protein